MKTGWGWKGGGYEYIQIKLFDNGRFEAVGLYGSLTHPLRKVYTNGTWISKDGVTFLTLPNFKKKLPIKKVFYLPNPNFTIKRVYEQKH